MKIDINLVKQLREATFAPLGDCKNALVEAGGDFDRAQEILKEKGIAKAGKKADRETKEGLVFVRKNGDYTVLAKLLCETDFVAKNEMFLDLFDQVFAILFELNSEVVSLEDLDPAVLDRLNVLVHEAVGTIGENMKLSEVHITKEPVFAYVHPGNKVVSIVYYTGAEDAAKELALQVAALNPEYLSFDEIPVAEVEKLAAEFTQELKDAGKPENMIAQIVKGKVDKAFADSILLEQEYIRDGSKKVKEILPADFVVSKFYRFAV